MKDKPTHISQTSPKLEDWLLSGACCLLEAEAMMDQAVDEMTQEQAERKLNVKAKQTMKECWHNVE